ncbi:MAG: hypothetical protein HY739_03795 [Desulfobacterales bacterium]|nr:hypothetical protein [Desulfobacterales bacterium]
MQEDRDYSVYPSDLNVLEAFKSFDEYLKSNGYTPTGQKSESHSLTIYDGEFRRLHAENLDEFMGTLSKHPGALPIYLHYYWKKGKDKGFSAIINVKRSGLEVCVRSDDLDIVSSIHDRIRTFFKASNPLEDTSERVSKYGLKKSIFLAHRFDEYGNKVAANVNTFLRRLGFNVNEGSGYETKNIPDKVAQKIRSQDIFICIFTPGDTSWILSETSFAKALGKYIIILCDDSLNINKGIVGGDYEHLPFPYENVEKCYSELLYSLPL